MTPKDLTPKEFHKLNRDAIKLYCDACWNLADVLALGKEKFGRKHLIEMSMLPKNKIDWFIAIASLKYRTNQLPELHYETCGVKNGKRWMKKAQEEALKPTELRQRIRKENGELHRQPKTLKMAQWPKSLLLAEMELKTFTGDKAKAAERLKPIADLYRQFSDTCSHKSDSESH